MKIILAGAGLSAMLLLPLAANAQQGRQQTDDQTSFSPTVRAQHSTPQRRQIIRSERSTRTSRGHNMSVGVGRLLGVIKNPAVGHGRRVPHPAGCAS